ncbi:MAG: carbon storage regulator [Gemmataceae bacterium]
MMLALTRMLGERIFIGDDVVITVVDISRGKVRLGIEAPKQVPIYREEVLQRLRAGQPKSQPE